MRTATKMAALHCLIKKLGNIGAEKDKCGLIIAS